MPHVPSELDTLSNTERTTKIVLSVMIAGLFLAGVLTVIILVGSIFHISDPGRQEAHLEQQSVEQQSAQPLTDKPSEADKL